MPNIFYEFNLHYMRVRNNMKSQSNFAYFIKPYKSKLKYYYLANNFIALSSCNLLKGGRWLLPPWVRKKGVSNSYRLKTTPLLSRGSVKIAPYTPRSPTSDRIKRPLPLIILLHVFSLPKTIIWIQSQLLKLCIIINPISSLYVTLPLLSKGYFSRMSIHYLLYSRQIVEIKHIPDNGSTAAADGDGRRRMRAPCPARPWAGSAAAAGAARRRLGSTPACSGTSKRLI